jgi:hypothetical protein
MRIRVVAFLWLLLLPTIAAAQSTGNYCEPSAAVKEEIKKVNNVIYDTVPFTFCGRRSLAAEAEFPGARRIVQSRFYDAHPYPKFESSDAEKQAYHKAVLQVTSEWVKRCF